MGASPKSASSGQEWLSSAMMGHRDGFTAPTSAFLHFLDGGGAQEGLRK